MGDDEGLREEDDELENRPRREDFVEEWVEEERAEEEGGSESPDGSVHSSIVRVWLSMFKWSRRTVRIFRPHCLLKIFEPDELF